MVPFLPGIIDRAQLTAREANSRERAGAYGVLANLCRLAALELTLEAMGYPVKRGAAVAAAEDVFATADRRGQD